MQKFKEEDLWIYSDPSTPLVEHFSESDYEKIQNTIKMLKDKQSSLNSQIEDRKSYVSKIEDKYNQYKTFYHMFENTTERNQSYFKMLLFLITIIIILVLIIISYFIYHMQK